MEETDGPVKDVEALAHVRHDNRNIGASIASGSFRTAGMVIAPCSVRTLAAVAGCHSGTLLTRAADVTLKEGRPLVALVRETPLHVGHLRQMLALAEMGGIVMPPMPAFYHRPASINELIDDTVERVLALIGVDAAVPKAWRGL